MISAPALSKKALEALLKENFSLGRLISFKRMKKGLGNALYHVKTTTGDFTLKIAIRNNPIRVRYEIDLLEHLTNLPVPKPLKTRKGEYLFNYGKYKSFIYPFLEGKQPIRVSDSLLKEVGKFLGKLHIQTANFSSRISRMKFYEISSKNIEVVMRDARKVKNPKIRRAIEYMGKEIPKYNLPKNLPHGAMHIDLKPENTLVKRGHLSGVVDFDNSYNGPLVLDLANTMMWYCSRKGKFDFKKARQIYKGYTKLRQLKRQEKASLYDALHYIILCHILANVYLQYSKDYPMISLPESYILWELDNLLPSQQNLKLSKREFMRKLT